MLHLSTPTQEPHTSRDHFPLVDSRVVHPPLTEVFERGYFSKFKGAAGSADSLSFSGLWRLERAAEEAFRTRLLSWVFSSVVRESQLSAYIGIFETILLPKYCCESCFGVYLKQLPFLRQRMKRTCHLRRILLPNRQFCRRLSMSPGGIDHMGRLKRPGLDLA
jgi:hypothetical protein